MGLLKQKSSYRPNRGETVLAWIVTIGSGAAVVWFVLRSFLARS